MKFARTIAIGLAAVLLCGCPLVDSKVLSGSREYFPKAEIYKPHPQMLHIETHVGNVSKKFAYEAFKAMIQRPEARDLVQGMELAGYRWLVLGFDDFNVVWDRSTGLTLTLDPQEAADWSLRTFGYMIGYSTTPVVR